MEQTRAKIRQHLDETGLSITRFAQSAGVGKDTIANFLRGRSRLTMPIMDRLSRVIDFTEEHHVEATKAAAEIKQEFAAGGMLSRPPQQYEASIALKVLNEPAPCDTCDYKRTCGETGAACGTWFLYINHEEQFIHQRRRQGKPLGDWKDYLDIRFPSWGWAKIADTNNATGWAKRITADAVCARGAA